jgi:hypothetical protein
LKRTIIIFVWLLWTVPLYAGTDLYFGPTSAGANNGTDCTDRYAYNDATNGIDGTGTASWAPGNTLHLCAGTWTGANGQQWVASHGNGSAGVIITVKFETGAVLSAPYHSVNGAILIQNTYITVDGGTNGIIQNTANGTATSAGCINGSCSTQQPSILVRVNSPATNIEIKNLVLSDAYVHDSATDTNDTAQSTVYGVYSLGNANVTIDHNVCHDAYYCFTAWGTGLVVSYNTTTHTGTAGLGSGINAPVTGLQIDHNSFVEDCSWYTTSNAYHLNGVHLFSNSGTGNYSGVVAYDNYFGGGCSTGSQTAHFYLEGSYTSPQVFNNVFDNQNGGSPFHNPCLWFETTTGGGGWVVSNALVVNNTFFAGDYATAGSTALENDSGLTGLTFQNSVVVGGTTMVVMGAGQASNAWDTAAPDYNAYDSTNNGANPFSFNGTAYTSFANWQAGLVSFGSNAADAHSINALPAALKVNTDGTLQTGSPIIGLGTNLTSLSIAALDTGAPQTFGAAGSCGTGCVARPGAGAWDAGAYEHITVTPPTAPMINLLIH